MARIIFVMTQRGRYGTIWNSVKFLLRLVSVIWNQIGCMVVLDNLVLEHFGPKTVTSDRVKLWDLQNFVVEMELLKHITGNAKGAICLQELNLELMQGKGGLQLEVEGLVSQFDTPLKDNEEFWQECKIFELKITNLEKVNAMASINNQKLIAEKAELELKHEVTKITQGKMIDEFNQY